MKNSIFFIQVFLMIFTLVSCSNESNEKSKSIIGNWELIGYFNTNPNQIDSEGFENNPVTITFNENAFNGNTPNNSFFGNYYINMDILIFNQINTTEVVESNWGIRFTSSLNEAYNNSSDDYILKYSIINDALIIEYNFEKFMKFERL